MPEGSSVLTVGSLAEELSHTCFCWVPNIGNAGDALIALGTFHFFDRLGLQPGICSQSDVAAINDFDLVLFGGGGNLVPYYKSGIEFLRFAARLGKQIVVLPHTTFGYESALIEIDD